MKILILSLALLNLFACTETSNKVTASVQHMYLRKAMLMDFDSFSCGPNFRKEPMDNDKNGLKQLKCSKEKSKEYTIFLGSKDGYIVQAKHVQYVSNCTKDLLAKIFSLDEKKISQDQETNSYYFWPEDEETTAGNVSGFTHVELSCKIGTDEFTETVFGEIENDLPTNPKGNNLDSLPYLSHFKGLNWSSTYSNFTQNKSCKITGVSTHLEKNQKVTALNFTCFDDSKPYSVLLTFSEKNLIHIILKFPYDKITAISQMQMDICGDSKKISDLKNLNYKSDLECYSTHQTSEAKNLIEKAPSFSTKNDVIKQMVQKLRRDIKKAYLNDNIKKQIAKNNLSEITGAYLWRVDENEAQGSVLFVDEKTATAIINQIKK